jgi:hypothetical protein
MSSHGRFGSLKYKSVLPASSVFTEGYKIGESVHTVNEPDQAPFPMASQASSKPRTPRLKLS